MSSISASVSVSNAIRFASRSRSGNGEEVMRHALSKTVATVITYPLQLGQVLIRLRKNEVKDLEQAGPSSMEIEEYNGMADCLYQQYTRGGFSSLFQGMSSKLVQTVGQASFIFVTYEQMLALVAKVIESR